MDLLEIGEVKIAFLPIFKTVIEIVKTVKSLYGSGGRRLKIRDVCMDF